MVLNKSRIWFLFFRPKFLIILKQRHKILRLEKSLSETYCSCRNQEADEFIENLLVVSELLQWHLRVPDAR